MGILLYKESKASKQYDMNIIFAAVVTLNDIVSCNMYKGCPYKIQLSSALYLEEIQDINI